MKYPKFAAVAAAAILSTGAASASTLNILEEVGDNFGSFTTSSDTFLLSRGSVSLFGSIETTCVGVGFQLPDCSSGDEADSISFSLPTDHEIQNLVLTFTDLSAAGIRFGGVVFNLAAFSFNQINAAGGVLPVPASDFGFGTTFGERFILGVSRTPGETIGDISFDYQISFDVVETIAPVPLPAALPMLLSGLLGTAFVARRRRKAST